MMLRKFNPALKPLCNSLCGPPTKRFGEPAAQWSIWKMGGLAGQSWRMNPISTFRRRYGHRDNSLFHTA